MVARLDVASEGRGATGHDVVHDASLRGVEVEACIRLVTMETQDVGDVEPGGSCVRARPEWVDVGHAGLSGEQRRQRGLPSGEVRGAEMEVAQRHIQGRMSEEELHGVDIDAGLEQVGGIGVAQDVGRHALA